MNELRNAHGLNEKEINKYALIYTTDKISVAKYKSNENDKMSSFTHNHEAYEFLIPLTTIPLLRYDNALYIGEVGYCYPVNPYVNHGLEFELNSDVISIVINKEYLDNLKKELNHEKDYFYTRFLVPQELAKDLSLLVNEQNDKIIYEITKILIIRGLEKNIDNRKPDNQYFYNMHKCILYMMDNYSNPDLSIKDIAKISDYSITYFTKAFKKYIGDTPINHLNKIRLSKAKMLMQDESLDIKDIALQSGYKNNSSFTEAFKRLIGKNPKDYRKNNILLLKR